MHFGKLRASLCSWYLLTWVLLLIFLVIGIWTHCDYAISRDYAFHDSYGQMVLDFYRSLGEDRSAIEDEMRIFGASFELFANLVRAIVPGDYHEVKHLANYLCALLGVVAAAKIARLMAGDLASFITTLFLLLTPAYYGHSFINPKDIPVATGHTWCLWVLAQLIYQYPKPRYLTFLQGGIVWGLMLGVRAGTIAFYPTLVLGLGLALFFWSDRLALPDRRLFVRVVIGLCLLSCVALFCLCLVWPLALSGPLDAIKMLISITSNFFARGHVLFWGTQVPIDNLPWYYIPGFFLVQLPEFLLLSMLTTGLLFYLVIVDRDLLSNRASFLIVLLVLCYSVVFPATLIAARKTVLYDGIRHVLFMIPVFCIIGALGVVCLLERLKPSLKCGLVVLLSSFLSLSGLREIQLHPYQYIYFNDLILGGTKGASQYFETDYWSTCMKEAIDWVYMNQPIKRDLVNVAAYAHPLQVLAYLRAESNLNFVLDESKADIYIAIERGSANQRNLYKRVASVNRLGVPLCFIYVTEQG